MGYSKDPEKRRRQLEALARNNPKMDVEALLAKHGLSAEAAPNKPSPAAPPPHPDPQHGRAGPEAPSGLVDTRAVDADVDLDDDEGLLLIFWSEGADPEHPSFGVRATEEAALALAQAILGSLEPEPEPGLDPGSTGNLGFDVAELRCVDHDRARSFDGSVYGEPGRIDLVLTDRDGRVHEARLQPEQTRNLRWWLKPGWFDEDPPEELRVDLEAAPAPPHRPEPHHAGAEV